jgi:hypothetical protein
MAMNSIKNYLPERGAQGIAINSNNLITLEYFKVCSVYPKLHTSRLAPFMRRWQFRQGFSLQDISQQYTLQAQVSIRTVLMTIGDL